MAFNIANFSLYSRYNISRGHGSHTFLYTTTDTLAEVSFNDDGYPASAYWSDPDMLKLIRAGDFIAVTASDGTALFIITPDQPVDVTANVTRIDGLQLA